VEEEELVVDDEEVRGRKENYKERDVRMRVSR
jgi:hypothetical protein